MKLKLKKDIVIPKDAVFENISGVITHYVYDNYECILALDNNTCATIVVTSENKEYFEVIE